MSKPSYSSISKWKKRWFSLQLGGLYYFVQFPKVMPSSSAQTKTEVVGIRESTEALVIKDEDNFVSFSYYN